MIAQWKRFLLSMISVLSPMIAWADDSSSMSFSPPASDYSVVFLGNIFGMVDGVLHGTGSQMMGTLLGVFNAAALALGGIVMIYIILVSTMNTAHEGQMLGQKWSSIWVPTRATIGLALLIPKASGYCMMQIFVMWVVLQGVGVADKMWGAALDYMNKGGVIIQTNLDPNLSIGVGSDNEIITGAATILYGQVCMQGLQTQLETVRASYLNAKDKGSGECAGQPSTAMTTFCEESVPDFINTVSPIATYNQNTEGAFYQVPMPNINPASSYSGLNGVCGSIYWNAMSEADITSVSNMSTISSSDLETIKASRAAAIEQVYISLSTTAKKMVDNDPGINSNGLSDNDVTTVASEQFGVALTSAGGVCTNLNDYCPNWGADPALSSTGSVLLEGTELQDAVADYNAVMSPTLKLIDDASDTTGADSERAFITKAKESGWIMAGSYFFNLANLNGSATNNTKTDTNTGFNKSTFDASSMSSAFGQSACQGTYQLLCTFITMNNQAMVTKVASLLNGSDATLSDGTGGLTTAVPKTDYSSASFSNVSGLGSSTVYGYTTNAALIDLAEQQGASTSITVVSVLPDLNPPFAEGFPKPNFSCKKQKIFGVKVCMSDDYINQAFKWLYSSFFPWYFEQMFLAAQDVFAIVTVFPLVGFGMVFQGGVDMLTQDGVNPIIGLAQMGVAYIDFAMDTWIAMIAVAVAGSVYPGTYALLTVTLPFFFAWEGIMLGIGFLTAYYIPFLPYMIFTFGAIAWLITVIEAMVAAPIVALGVAHPEGHDALGKSEQGLMILLNVFLRPGMMVIGYIAGIAVSFVGVWIMSAGFQNIFNYLQTDAMWGRTDTLSLTNIAWAKYFGTFFGALIYIEMYLVIVQKSFTLISVLPDKVLRWIGGTPEGVGQETMQWGEETKTKMGEGGKSTASAGGAMQKQTAAGLAEGLGVDKDKDKDKDKGPSKVESSPE